MDLCLLLWLASVLATWESFWVDVGYFYKRENPNCMPVNVGHLGQQLVSKFSDHAEGINIELLHQPLMIRYCKVTQSKHIWGDGAIEPKYHIIIDIAYEITNLWCENSKIACYNFPIVNDLQKSTFDIRPVYVYVQFIDHMKADEAFLVTVPSLIT